jgi:hypothetical protein
VFDDTETFTPETMDERSEGAIRGTLTRLAHSVGADAFRDAVIRATLPYEARLRRECPPDHPSLKLLDEYHAERAWRP